MFKYVTSALWSRFHHPVLVSLFIIGGILLAIGGVLDFVATSPIAGTLPGVTGVRTSLGVEAMRVAAGFAGVYAALTFAIGLFGYAILYLARIVSRVRDRIVLS